MCALFTFNCALHIQLICPLLSIQHNQCPCRCLLDRAETSSVVMYVRVWSNGNSSNMSYRSYHTAVYGVLLRPTRYAGKSSTRYDTIITTLQPGKLPTRNKKSRVHHHNTTTTPTIPVSSNLSLVRRGGHVLVTNRGDHSHVRYKLSASGNPLFNTSRMHDRSMALGYSSKI